VGSGTGARVGHEKTGPSRQSAGKVQYPPRPIVWPGPCVIQGGEELFVICYSTQSILLCGEYYTSPRELRCTLSEEKLCGRRADW